MTRKPRQIIGSDPLGAIPKDYNRYCDKITGNANPILNPEVVARVAEITADGGTVEDITFYNAFVTAMKNAGVWGDIVAAYSPSWGVKGTTTASKLYSIIGAAQDLEQTTGANQPGINTADLNSRTRILFDGVDDFVGPTVFTFDQPATQVLMGFEQESWSANDNITDGGGALLTIMRQSNSTPTPDLELSAGAGGPVDSGAVLTTARHLRALFNGAASAIQVDASAESTGNAGTSDLDGLTLGARKSGAVPSHFSVGAVVLLSSTVDASYAAKMAAIYNFSKSSYGTP